MAQVQHQGKGSRNETRARSGKSRNAPIGESDTPSDSRSTIDVDLRQRLISEAAYRLYAERGYADGYDLDDWLQAEAAVDHRLTSAESTFG